MSATINRWLRFAAAETLLSFATSSRADDFTSTTRLFRNSNEAAGFFHSSYGYVVIPTIGEGGFIVAGAHGKGRAYVGGAWVGNVSVTQVTVGAQAGAKAYSQMIFFEDKRAFDRFATGEFEFGADASAVAITAGATASAGTKGASAGASGGKNDAGTMGGYHDGMAVFTIVKGGAMVSAALGGQKYSYTRRRR
jgi:lipid-binding SYLF domain-containing protein